MIYPMQHIEEAIQNYSPIVMFRGTPCISMVQEELCLCRDFFPTHI